jgi:hypothetical protein
MVTPIIEFDIWELTVDNPESLFLFANQTLRNIFFFLSSIFKSIKICLKSLMILPLGPVIFTFFDPNFLMKLSWSFLIHKCF